MAETVERAEDLYAVELSDFVRERNALAARLKAAGDKDGAAEVKAMRKPPRSAWALNVMARAEPAVVDTVLDAARRVAAAVGGGGGGDVRAAQGDYTRAVAAAVEAAAAASGLAGDQVGERVRATLLAAGAEPDGEVATHLRAGTLADDADAPGFSFAGMTPALDDDTEPVDTGPVDTEPDEQLSAESEPASAEVLEGEAADGAEGASAVQQAADVAAQQEAAERAVAEAEAAAAAEAAAKAAAAAERRRARRRLQVEREIERVAQRLSRLTERAEAAEAAAEHARAAVRSTEAELADARQRLDELEHPDG